jgi:hypothetical protein
MMRSSSIYELCAILAKGWLKNITKKDLTNKVKK